MILESFSEINVILEPWCQLKPWRNNHGIPQLGFPNWILHDPTVYILEIMFEETSWSFGDLPVVHMDSLPFWGSRRQAPVMAPSRGSCWLGRRPQSPTGFFGRVGTGLGMGRVCWTGVICLSLLFSTWLESGLMVLGHANKGNANEIHWIMTPLSLQGAQVVGAPIAELEVLVTAKVRRSCWSSQCGD